MSARRIRDLDDLADLAGGESGVEVAILLDGGGRSSKHIWYLAPHGRYRVGRFRVWNLIDIGAALEAGALVLL